MEKGRSFLENFQLSLEKAKLNIICGENLVKLRVFDLADDNRGRIINIYDGKSDGYDEDFKINEGQKIMEEVSTLEKGTKVHIFLKPKNGKEDEYKLIRMKKNNCSLDRDDTIDENER